MFLTRRLNILFWSSTIFYQFDGNIPERIHVIDRIPGENGVSYLIPCDVDTPNLNSFNNTERAGSRKSREPVILTYLPEIRMLCVTDGGEMKAPLFPAPAQE